MEKQKSTLKLIIILALLAVSLTSTQIERLAQRFDRAHAAAFPNFLIHPHIHLNQTEDYGGIVIGNGSIEHVQRPLFPRITIISSSYGGAS